MMEMFVFFVSGLCFQFSVFYSHPLVLGMSLLVITVSMGGVLCYYGPLFSFCVFMVTVAGVLVVFSYTISLVPFKGPDYDDEDEKDRYVKLKSWSKDYPKPIKSYSPIKMLYGFFEWEVRESEKERFMLHYIALFLFFSSVLAVMYSSLNSEEIGAMVLSYSEIGYFSEDYSFVLVWMGVLLFIVMIFGMSVASRYEGALIE